jgi:hypothetical protein
VHYLGAARIVAEFASGYEVRSALPRWQKYLDVSTYEFFQRVTRHVCEALVEIAYDTMII